MSLKLNEILGPTIQGEGIFTGCPSMFVRVQGCSLRCPQCDTKQSWTHKGERTPLAMIENRLQVPPHLDIVITGGEPLDEEHVEGVMKLAQWAFFRDRRVTIETSGQCSYSKVLPLRLFQAVDLWSVSPKLPAMGFDSPQVNQDFADILQHHDCYVQLKFVVSPETLSADLKMIQTYLDIYRFHSSDPQHHVIFQVATKHADGLARDQILSDWAKLVDALLQVVWVRKFRPQILPQAHRLIGVD
jgi:organic radical activating enzyme